MNQVYKLLTELGYRKLNVISSDEDIQHWINWELQTVIAFSSGRDVSIVSGTPSDALINTLTELLVIAYATDYNRLYSESD